MDVKGFIQSQFIEIIEWVDDGKDNIIYKFPDEDREIKMNAQLIVRESQVALFMSEGIIADVFVPGRYELTAKNIPVLSRLRGWKYGFSSPFKADVYFVNTKQFIAKKWGTSNPVLMRDPEFGIIRLRAFGNYGFRITDAQSFFREIAGTNSIYTTDGVYNHLRSIIVSTFSDVVGTAKIPIVDMVGNYAFLGTTVLEKLEHTFQQIGVSISTFVVENIALPPDVEKYVDRRSSMGVIGDFKAYTEFQVADSIKAAAENPGGIAGLGAGFVIGKKIADSVLDSEKPESAQAEVKKSHGNKVCSRCDTDNTLTAKFCINCGAQLAAAFCSKCKSELPKGAKFCPACGQETINETTCTKCGAVIQEGAKFCQGCGQKTQ